MILNQKLYTTSKKFKFISLFPSIIAVILKSKGVSVQNFEVEYIDIKEPKTKKDSEGDVRIDWVWFKENVTNKTVGRNSVALHISRAEKKRWGLTKNGSYNSDPDDIFEFWFSADTEKDFFRLFLHELGHGFERWTYGKFVQFTHYFDYVKKDVTLLFPLMDFTAWNEANEKRNLLQMTLDKLKKQLDMKLHRITLAPCYITQKFGVQNTLYKTLKHHAGTDIRASVGTPLYAPADGEITKTFANHKELGNACYYEFSHLGTKYVMRVLHLAEVPVKGKYKKGTVIALSGNTGMSTAPHVHIDIMKDVFTLTGVNQANFRSKFVNPETLPGLIV